MKDCQRIPKHSCFRPHGGSCQTLGCPDYREASSPTHAQRPEASQIIVDLNELVLEGNPIGVDAYLHCLDLQELSEQELLSVLVSTNVMKSELEARSKIHERLLSLVRTDDCKTLKWLDRLR